MLSNKPSETNFPCIYIQAETLTGRDLPKMTEMSNYVAITQPAQ